MIGKAPTYSRCKECGHRDEGVCALMFGHRCDACGAKDAATIVRRKTKDRER